MKSVVRSVSKHRRTLLDVATLSSWSALAQIITFASFPLLTRIYSPEHIGATAIFVSLVSFAYALSPFQVDQIVLNAQTENDVRLSASAFIFCSTIIAFIFWIALLGLKAAGFFSFQSIPWLAFIGFPLFIGPAILSKLTATMALREKNFLNLALCSSVPQVLTVFIKIITGYFSPSLWSLLASDLLYYWQVLSLSTFQIKEPLRKLLPLTSAREALETLTKYRSVLMGFQSATLFNSLNVFLNIQIIAFLFSPKELGLFSIGFGLVSALNRNVNGSINQVLAQRCAQYRREGRTEVIAGVFVRAIWKIAALNLGIALLGGVAGYYFLDIAFGEKWMGTAYIFPALMSIYWALALSMPCETVLKIALQPKVTVRMELLVLTMKVLSVIACLIASWSLVSYLWVTGIALVLLSWQYIISTYRQLQKDRDGLKRTQ